MGILLKISKMGREMNFVELKSHARFFYERIPKSLKFGVVILSSLFVCWVGIQVFTKGDTFHGEASKKLRSELRLFLKSAFPESARRVEESYGLFENKMGRVGIETNEWVFLVHGLDEPGELWGNLAPALLEEGYRVFEFRYPNDQPIHDSAVLLGKHLEAILADESDGKNVSFIGHSMGGLVLREFITHPELMIESEWNSHHNMSTLIQVATPNHGSWLSTYRLPIEIKDHFSKEHGVDAMLAMIWDGAGEAGIDLHPESEFIHELNDRPFPVGVRWVGIGGNNSPVDFSSFGDGKSVMENPVWRGPLEKIKATLPEVFDGKGDGAISVESLTCEEMDMIYLLDGDHRSILRDKKKEPPSISIILRELQE